MMSWPFGNLQMHKYGAILVDPPWSYKMYSKKGHKKSPESHYVTMSDSDIYQLPVMQLASGDCMIFMWAIWPKLDIALLAMKTWGFTFKTGGVWHKKTAKNNKTAFGTGYILRSACEPFLVGTVGRPKISSRSERNLIEAPLREHSRKPTQMREKIQALRPGSFACELFSREAWPGNETWGHEVDKFNG